MTCHKCGCGGSSCKSCKSTRSGGGLLSFSGRMPTSSVGGTPAFLANPGQAVNAAATPPNYPIPANRTVGNFAARILTSETLAGALTVELVQDVLPAGTGGTVLKTVTFPAGAAVAGTTLTDLSAPVVVPAGHTLDVRVTTAATLPSNTDLSAVAAIS